MELHKYGYKNDGVDVITGSRVEAAHIRMAHLNANRKRVDRQIKTPELAEVAKSGLYTQTLLEFVTLLDSVSRDYPSDWSRLVSTRDTRLSQAAESKARLTSAVTDHYENNGTLDSQKTNAQILSPLASIAIDMSTVKLVSGSESYIDDMADSVLEYFAAFNEADGRCNEAMTEFPAFPIPGMLSDEERMAIFEMMSRGVGSVPSEKTDILFDQTLTDLESSEVITRNSAEIDEKGVSCAISVLLSTFPNREFTYEDLVRFGLALDNAGYWKNDYGHVFGCIALLAPDENYININGYLSDSGLVLQTGWRRETVFNNFVANNFVTTEQVERITRICRAVSTDAILDRSSKDYKHPDQMRGYVVDSWD